MAGKLITDWFGRRSEDEYTHRNENRFFSWDMGRSNLSSFLTRRNSKKTFSNAPKILASMFKVLDVPKLARMSANNHIEKNKIHIPISMLKDEDGNYTDNIGHLDAFYGAAIQNASLRQFQSLKDYTMTLKAKNTDRPNFKLKDLLFTVLNTERIDKKLSERFPGYLKFVQKYKKYKYDENYEEVKEDAHPRHHLLDLVLKMLRYPTNLDEDKMNEFEEPMKHMQRLLKKFGGIPATADECKRMATSIANMIYKYVDEEEEETKKENKTSDNSDENAESNPSANPMNSDDLDEVLEEMSKKEMDNLAKEYLESLVSEENVDLEENPDIMDEFEEGMQEEAGSSKKIDYSHEGEAVEEDVSFVRASRGNKEAYQSIVRDINVNKAAVLRKLFERKNRDYKFAIKSMRSGRLDSGKIAEAIQNVPTVYERIGEVKSDKICVGVLIDESGSMCGAQIAKAREAAVFINEVFKNSKDVDLFIYGHTADEYKRDTSITIYKDKQRNPDPYALSQVRSRCNNRDGVAILATAKAIRSQTDRKGILFVISDGQPAAHGYNGTEAIKDTARKVKIAEKLGFQVIQIAIDECVPSEEMFTYFVKMTNISNLPNDLTMYLSRKVDKLIKETVTL